jgi:hypothetical protein
MFYDILFGVICGITASIIIVYFLRCIKPKILISEKIAKGKSSNGEIEYKIKILNMRSRSIIDVIAELYIIKPLKVPLGLIPEHSQVKLKIEKLMEIAGKNKKVRRELYEGANFIFLTYENIETILSDESDTYLLIRIGTTDSFSGVRKVFTKEFFHKNDIIIGEFEKGQSVKIN